MSFKPGDTVIVIQVEGVRYPADAGPGTIATIEHRCECLVAWVFSRCPMWSIAIPTRSLCAAEIALRKIDLEGRKVVRWDTVPWQPERERAPA